MVRTSWSKWDSFPETLVSSIHVYIHQIFLELTLVKKGEEVDEYGEANAVNE